MKCKYLGGSYELMLHDHFADCSLEELKNQSTAGAIFLTDASSLDDVAAQYSSCDTGIRLLDTRLDTRLDTATVAYYNGTTPGSRVCFLCDKSNGYALNTTFNETYCQKDGTWSRNSTICGTMFKILIFPTQLFSFMCLLYSKQLICTLSIQCLAEF